MGCLIGKLPALQINPLSDPLSTIPLESELNSSIFGFIEAFPAPQK